MQFFTLGNSKIEVFETVFCDTVITYNDHPPRGPCSPGLKALNCHCLVALENLQSPFVILGIDMGDDVMTIWVLKYPWGLM